jgi:hypothetical protein
MTAAQAADFVTRYTAVLTTYRDGSTGLDLTVFSDATGNLTIAFRGTSEVVDLVPPEYAAALNSVIAANWQ